MAYNLLQIYLLHRGRKELNQKTLPRIRQELLPSDNHIIVYYQNYYAMFASFELIGFVVMLQEEPRKKIAAYCQRIGREQSGAMQMTFTEGAVIKVLHAMNYRRWPKGCIYLFPTLDTVTDFSASRFNPLIRDNPEAIGQYIRDTNRANLKRIGDDFLYFRSGRLCQEIQGQAKTSAGLISVPGDHAVHDEYDLMSQRIDEFVDGRLAKSEIKTKTFLSNPTLPDFGISAKFDESDQRYWFAKCGHCGAWTCFDDEDCTHRCSLSTAQLARNYITSAERRISWGTYVEGGEQIIKHAKEVLARLSN